MPHNDTPAEQPFTRPQVIRLVHEVVEDRLAEMLRDHLARYHASSLPVGTLEDLLAHLERGS